MSLLRQHQCLADLLVGRGPARPVRGATAWKDLVALAQSEGVGPLLHRALAAQPGLDVPVEAREALAAEYTRAVYASILQQSVQTSLCRRLGERAIPVLLLKGAALASTYYEDPATRPMADVDLLVPRSRLEEAARCLEEAGFQPTPSSLAVALRSPWGHLFYRHRSTQAALELHWDLSEMRRVPDWALKEVWANARRAGADQTALIMHPGHHIPLLCAHMILRRQYTTLRSQYDLHRVLLSTGAAEAMLARDAAIRWRLAPCTAHALMRVNEWFGTPLADGLYAWAREEVSRQTLQGRVAQWALTPGTIERPSGDLVDLVVNRNWSKLRICFPTADTLRQRYGLSEHQSVLPAFLAHVGRYLRKGPAEFRRLWSAGLTVPRPLAVAEPRCAGEIGDVTSEAN